MNINIDQLTDQLWTGGDLPDGLTDAINILDQYRELGITRIIDCRKEWNDAELVELVAPEIRYLHAGVNDNGQKQPDEWFRAVADFANEGGITLAHCHMGINRGPSAAYAILLSQGWDPVDAIDLIRTNRPIALIDYAEDALDWHHRATGATKGERKSNWQRLNAWRKANPHDTYRIIKEINGTDDVWAQLEALMAKYPSV